MSIGARIEAAVVRFRSILDKGQIARTVMLYGTLYMTFDSYRWCIRFAETSQRPGTDIAMIIAAVLSAISVLQGYVFKAYLDARPEGEATK